MAILEAIDRDLDERGLVDKAGKPRYLLNHRWRVSRQLDHWLAKISDAIQRQSAAGQQPQPAERADYIQELQRIALGHDPSASARDRLTALKELLTLDATPGPGAVIHLHYNQDGEAETIERQDESELSEQSTATS
ncbi:MAG TPA: hypothetical protein VIL73_12325 [Gaiellaceae bacterium]|jgi:hypothetical protein